MKQQILRELDETGLLVGASLNQALLANDRAKYLLTLLQLAFEQARRPRAEPDDLSLERRQVQLDYPVLDTVIPTARNVPGDGCKVQGIELVLDLLAQSCREMLLPIGEANSGRAAELDSRLKKLVADRLTLDGGGLSEEWLGSLTRVSRGDGDTVHLFVMDAHRALLKVQRELGQTTVDGVPAHGIRDEDRELVRAFAESVRRTARLKLDHPGLGSAASRYDGRLVIQNDIGLTDSHVIVVAVGESEISVTYTDIHNRRLAFFRQLLADLEPSWKEVVTRSSTVLEEGECYRVLTGTVPAASPGAKKTLLAEIGSRLVFLIDWNKARKRLRNFMGNKSAIRVLQEAARREVGHMAFLNLGAEELVYQALDVAAGDHLRIGEPFHAAVGSKVAEECFIDVLTICHEGVSGGDSAQVIRDRVVASLKRAFARTGPQYLLFCRRIAVLIVEAALTLQHAMRFLRSGKDGIEFLSRSQSRIASWESEADELLNRLRRREARRPSGIPLRELSGALDDALDNIDQGAYFLAKLEPPEDGSALLRGLDELTGVLVRGAQEFHKALAAYSESSERRSEEDLTEFFESIGRLDGLEKLKDAREREFLERIFALSAPSGRDEMLREIGARISSAVDSLSHAGFILYDSIFNPGQLGG